MGKQLGGDEPPPPPKGQLRCQGENSEGTNDKVIDINIECECCFVA